MSKLFFLLVIAVFAVGVNADAFGNFGFPNFAAFQLPGFPGFPNFQMPAIPPIKMITPDDIKNMVPQDGNTVMSGGSVSSSSTMEMVNGVPVKKVSRGRIVTNDNGKITDTSFGN